MMDDFEGSTRYEIFKAICEAVWIFATLYLALSLWFARNPIPDPPPAPQTQSLNAVVGDPYMCICWEKGKENKLSFTTRWEKKGGQP